MTLRWQALCVDVEDPSEAATFWAAALGWRRTHDEPDEVVLEPPAGSPEDGVSPDLLFLRVPEAKTVKNRLHLDLAIAVRSDPVAARTADVEAEVARLTACGATVIARVSDHDHYHITMGDPEGNEFDLR